MPGKTTKAVKAAPSKKSVAPRRAPAPQQPTRRPKSRAEELMMLEALRSIVQGLEPIVGPNVEIVVHDLRHPRSSTFAIANGHVTGRRVGDPIIASPAHDKGFWGHERAEDSVELADQLGLYKSRAKDGRELKSTTIALRNDAGEVFGTVCANSDLTLFQLMQSHLQQIIQPIAETTAPNDKARPSVDELIDEIINESLASIGKPVIAMDKDDKLRVMRMMIERGLFVIKGSAEKVAHHLQVTRFT
ncbi:MAG: helix-turn-helix transcriptional regulator, partial [Solimonas sp.]